MRDYMCNCFYRTDSSQQFVERLLILNDAVTASNSRSHVPDGPVEEDARRQSHPEPQQ